MSFLETFQVSVYCFRIWYDWIVIIYCFCFGIYWTFTEHFI